MWEGVGVLDVTKIIRGDTHDLVHLQVYIVCDVERCVSVYMWPKLQGFPMTTCIVTGILCVMWEGVEVLDVTQTIRLDTHDLVHLQVYIVWRGKVW